MMSAIFKDWRTSKYLSCCPEFKITVAGKDIIKVNHLKNCSIYGKFLSQRLI